MNEPLSTPPTTDPAQILRYRDRQYAAEFLAVAISHFDLFSWLEKNPQASARDICIAFDFAERPADVLLTLCRANGFITTDAEGRNSLTTLAREHLVNDSPWFLGPYYAPIRDTPIVRAFLEVLQTGKPANWQAQADGDDWHESMMSEEFARGFTQLMNCRGLAMGQALAKAVGPLIGDRSRLLDVGGGSGIYAAAMAAAVPQIEAIVFEQPPVDAITREEIARHNLADRISVLSGNMFEDPWPSNSDMLLLSNALHDWDFPEVRLLLEKAAEALPPGGLLIVHEAFIDDDKTGPLPVAEYSALLANITQGKCYTPGEYGAIMKEVGFEVGSYRETIADRGFMTALRQ